MKKDNIVLVFIMILMMSASFYAGYFYSPDKNEILDKDTKIRELKDTIIQQQINNSYIIKHMNDFQIKNWSMNK